MAVKEVERKISRIGNSHGVSVQKFVPLNVDVLKDIDQDFLDGLQDLLENYDDTLRNLADR
ncbi:hypothetical protein MUB24_11375 [Lederbergia sp. NSJ-179]|uniref:hypothetical protein n=1 Tax=Lederbergia sp. NSJ-179 TaxID=2931402 RepID=UPI001FD534CA|nr:hypothetical protein [Lederbergia sp. NSJ-179]MCJ7841485.1 hypothetical protein [Lederbergia sp. NSJ-179]